MLTYVIILAVLLCLLLISPKFTSGRILYTENYVPKLQAYRKMVDKDLRNMSVRIDIAHRKLYRVRLFKILKPILEMLPSSYTVSANKKGTFMFWAYPFDLVHITLVEDKFRATYTLRHRVKNQWPVYKNIYQSLVMMISPKLLHDECIEIHTTLGKTCGYSDSLSLLPGEETNLFISTAAASISMKLIRVGEKLITVDEINEVDGTYQNIETKFPAVLGCGWKPTMKYKLPDYVKSGCYILNLNGKDSDDTSFIPFIVRPEKVVNEIAVIASTNTWHAYNSWGGSNYYINYTSFPSKYIISTERPFDLSFRNPLTDSCEISRDHLLVGERFIWAWLEKEHIGYDLYSDLDLHSEDIYQNMLSRYKAIIISTHNEYWSYPMINHLKEYINNGGNVLSLSGDTLYKEVEFRGNSLIVLDGALFRYQGLCEESILGVAHDQRGFTTWAPYKVLKADHWAFNGTNLKDGDLIGQKGLNVSPDEKPGASGWETDKIYPETPKDTILLARGINPDGGGADMIMYEIKDGGRVFSVGSITFGGSLLVDENISKITRNVIQNFLDEK